ncbi:hypothetical protein BBJ28_00018883 [Nothophytophthora sp. Chile5]|nr:hypothetical protein BBJ28_00018883 [Nothophytophthora sp. Chile5]
MKDMESDMAELALELEDFQPKPEPSESSEDASSSDMPDQLAFLGDTTSAGGSSDDDDITSQLLSMLAEEMSQKKRKRSMKAAGGGSGGSGRHRKALVVAAPENAPTDELKREKNRDSVKRSYYRKIETLGELRAHTDYLRDQYNSLLSQWQDKTEREKAETAKDPSSLMNRYLELSRQRDRLWMENTQLHEQFEDREKVSFRFQRLFDVNYQLMDHSIAAPTEEEEERRVQTPMLIMDEMSFESFTRFAQEAQQTFETFLSSRRNMITTETALGWTCSHVAKDNSFGYYFEKHFRRGSYASASDVALTAWQTLTSPDRHSKLYAPALHTRFHIMQQFDNNSYVLYRTMEKEGEDSITTALIIMTRIPHPNDTGCLIICKGLRREEHTLHVEFSEAIALQKKKEWRQSMYWINIEELPPSDEDNNNEGEEDDEGEGGDSHETRLKVVHGGIMNNMGDRSRSFWLFENLQIALRWEQNLGLGEPLS